MNLKELKDKNLIEDTLNLVRKERDLLTNVLHHLLEIDRRRLYSALKYKSLFDFAVRHLGYPEDQAGRRIAAMRLLRELPEIEEKINKGNISLTHIGLAQTLFNQEKKFQNKEMTHEQKISVLEKIANKPVREAERITLAMSSVPHAPKPDRVKAISENQIEMKFAASVELRQKVERLKGLLAHSNPKISLGELFEKLCDLGLAEWNPAKNPKRASKRKVEEHEKTAAPRMQEEKISQAQVRRDVFEKAENECVNCGSHFAPQVDHTQHQRRWAEVRRHRIFDCSVVHVINVLLLRYSVYLKWIGI